MNSMAENVILILYISSITKNLMCYILLRILSVFAHFCQHIYSHQSHSRTVVCPRSTLFLMNLSIFWMNCVNQWFNVWFIKRDSYFIPEWIELTTYSLRHLKSSFPKRDKRQIKKKWVRHAILLCTEPIHCSINVSCQIAIFPCLKCTARCSSFPNRYKRRTCF